MKASAEFRERASLIKLLVMDVDGVLTDGGLHLDPAGGEIKIFHVRDGSAVVRGLSSGLIIAWMSGRIAPAVYRRAEELGVKEVHQGVEEKAEVLRQLMEKYSLRSSETACLVDDLPDLPLVSAVGLSLAVADAHPEVKNRTDLVTSLPGGRGAAMEAVDFFLAARSRGK